MTTSNGNGNGAHGPSGVPLFILRGRAPAFIANGPHVYLTVEVERDGAVHTLHLGPIPPEEVKRWQQYPDERVEVIVRGLPLGFTPRPPPPTLRQRALAGLTRVLGG